MIKTPYYERRESVVEMLSEIIRVRYRGRIENADWYKRAIDWLSGDPRQGYPYTDLHITDYLCMVYRYIDDIWERRKLVEIIKYMEIQIFTDELSGDYKGYNFSGRALEKLKEFIREYGNVE